jgi:hypothetical protein
MKYLVVLVLAAGMVWHGTAKAEISENLKFCAKLGAGKERLACYDAAARIEKRADRKAEIGQVQVSAVKAPALPANVTPSRFNGAYAAITGGYDFAEASPSVVGGSFPITYLNAVSGPKVGAVIGYNAVSGSLLLGFEARAQYAFGDTHTFYESGVQTLAAKVTRPLSGDLSARAGLILNDWLAYSRIGLGVEQTRSIYVSNVYTNANITSNPVVLLAAGVERNFGNYFLRAEAEWMVHFGSGVGAFGSPSGDNIYYTPAVNVAAGYRF